MPLTTNTGGSSGMNMKVNVVNKEAASARTTVAISWDPGSLTATDPKPSTGVNDGVGLAVWSDVTISGGDTMTFEVTFVPAAGTNRTAVYVVADGNPSTDEYDTST